jgi:regulatory protein
VTTHRPSCAERRARADARRAERADVEDPAVVLEAAAAFLAVRPRSVDETRRRLRHLGYPAALIEVVIDRLRAYGYLDDASFARAWVESRDRARPRGESALRRELTLKGIDRELIAAVLAGRDDEVAEPARDVDGVEGSFLPPTADESRSADEVAGRRLIARRSSALARESDPRRRRQKVYALLARNGFSPDVCARLSSEAVAGTDVGDRPEAPAEGV